MSSGVKPREFRRLTEDILLMLYDRTANYQHKDWDLVSAFTALGKEAEKTQSDAVLQRLVDKGWVVAEQSLRLQRSLPVRLTELGKTTAIQILDQRAPKSLIERFQQVPRSDWIAFAAFVVSLIALFA